MRWLNRGRHGRFLLTVVRRLKSPLKLAKPLGIAAVVSFLIAYLMWYRIVSSDPLIPDAEAYVRENKEVLSIVGSVEEVRLAKWSQVSSRLDSDGYRIYRFEVGGKEGKAPVEVRIEGSSAGFFDRHPTLRALKP